MSEHLAASRSARRSLVRGLIALQEPGVPLELLDAAEPLAWALGALGAFEAGQGHNPRLHGRRAASAIREVLARLQEHPDASGALEPALEAVAGALGQVHQLVHAAAPSTALAEPGDPNPYGQAPQEYAHPRVPAGHAPSNPPAPQAAPGAQHAPPQYAVQHAPPQYAAPQPAPIQPQHAAPQHAAPQPAPTPRQAAPAASASVNIVQPEPVVRTGHEPPPWAQRDPTQQSAGGYGAAVSMPPRTSGIPSMRVAPPPRTQPPPGALLVLAELGAHSATNFYKGLSGNDVIESGGIFIATYQLPEIGRDLWIKVTMPGGYELDARGTVVWTREPSVAGTDAAPGFGARLTEISPEGRQLVYRYVRNREPLFHDDL